MKTPHIDEARFASLSLIGSLAVIPAAAAWRSHVIPEHFGWAFGAGLAMFASASLPYLLFPRRIRPATLAGSLWAAAGFWLLFIMMANGSDAYTDPADPRFNRHGSGFLWIGLPLFFAGALIAAIVGTASRPRLLSLDKSALQAFRASLCWSFLGTIWLLMIDPVSLLTVIAFVWICNQPVHFIDRKTSGQAQTENHPSDS